jgi:hypothetical protein
VADRDLQISILGAFCKFSWDPPVNFCFPLPTILVLFICFPFFIFSQIHHRALDVHSRRRPRVGPAPASALRVAAYGEAPVWLTARQHLRNFRAIAESLDLDRGGGILKFHR